MDKPGHYRMPFGKYKGQLLDEVARTDRGLLYLDWLIGDFDDGECKSAVLEYLKDEAIESELARAIQDKENF